MTVAIYNMMIIIQCEPSHMTNAAQALPTPQQAARIFITPARGKARIPEVRPADARARTVPFGDDGTLAVWEWGEADRPAVLLVHGWEGTHADMDNFVAPLLKDGYRVATFDLPAHGASNGKRAPIPLLAKAIRHVAETVGPLHGVIAHSIGCAATVTSLTRGLKAERVVLVSSPSNYRRQAKLIGKMVGINEKTWPDMEVELNALGAELSEIDFTTMAKTLTLPALVMHSDDDQVVPMQDSREATSHWRGATFRLLSGLGHMRVLSDADVIASSVAFIKGS